MIQDGGNVDAVGSTDAAGGRRRPSWRVEARSFIELFALTGVAIVQPLLDSLRRNAHDTFVTSGASPVQIVALVALILIGPPAILWAIELLIGIAWPAARRFVHAGIGGLIVGTIVAEVLGDQTGFETAARLAIALPFAVLAALLLLRVPVVGTFLRFLALAPLAFALLFVMNDQVRPLVLTSRVANASDVTVRRPDRVVLIVMDELPLESLLDGTGHIDAGLYPNFAGLARDSTWYRNTTTVAPYTNVAVPALLTGSYPTDPQAVPTASVYPHNLFTLLGNRYQLNTHENAEALNPAGDAEPAKGLTWMARKSLDLWMNLLVPSSTGSLFSQRISDQTLDAQIPAGRRFLDSLHASKRARLDYLHVLLPHVPWHLLPDGRSYSDEQSVPGQSDVWTDQVLADVARQRHLLQVQAADRLLGQIVAKLRSLGAYDPSLVVVTADHGEAFTVGNPLRNVTAATYPQVMWVPLFVKEPGHGMGTIDDRPARSIDVLPTIADELGADLPWKVDGHSLLDAPRPDGPRKFFDIASELISESNADARYREWDGPSGFAKVLASRAAAPGTDNTLRIYEGGSRYGALVGHAEKPLAKQEPSDLAVGLNHPERFEDVDLNADSAPWTYVDGFVGGGVGDELAIGVNGTVGSLATVAPNPFLGGGTFVAVLPPSLFRAGRNQITISVVGGAPDAPTLAPMRLGS